MKPEEMAHICYEIESHYRTRRDDNSRRAWIKSMYEFFGTEAKETVLAGVRLAMLESEFEPKPALIQRGIDTIRKRKNLKIAEEIFEKLRDKAKQNWSEERVINALSNSRLPEAICALRTIGWSYIVDPYPHLTSDIKTKFCNSYNSIIQRNKQEQQKLEIIDPQITNLIRDIPVKRIA